MEEKLVLRQLTLCKSNWRKENVVIMQPLGIKNIRLEMKQEKVLTAVWSANFQTLHNLNLPLLISSSCCTSLSFKKCIWLDTTLSNSPRGPPRFCISLFWLRPWGEVGCRDFIDVSKITKAHLLVGQMLSLGKKLPVTLWTTDSRLQSYTCPTLKKLSAKICMLSLLHSWKDILLTYGTVHLFQYEHNNHMNINYITYIVNIYITNITI